MTQHTPVLEPQEPAPIEALEQLPATAEMRSPGTDGPAHAPVAPELPADVHDHDLQRHYLVVVGTSTGYWLSGGKKIQNVLSLDLEVQLHEMALKVLPSLDQHALCFYGSEHSSLDTTGCSTWKDWMMTQLKKKMLMGMGSWEAEEHTELQPLCGSVCARPHILCLADVGCIVLAPLVIELLCIYHSDRCSPG